MKTKQALPPLVINDAAQMRDAFQSRLADAIADDDIAGQLIYSNCVNYWGQKAKANQYEMEPLTL